MNTETVLYIVLSGIIALAIALFQYKYKTKSNASLLAILRFLGVFAILLLLVNPKIESNQTYVEKPTLAVVVDNTHSISHFKQESTVREMLSQLKSHEALAKKFNIDVYTFDEALNQEDSLTFTGKQSNISAVFSELQQIYATQNAPTVLVTDGNQTYGADFSYTAKKYPQHVYPIVVGDTTKYSDLKIQQVNTNKYAYLKNKFPVEIIVVYNGQEPVRTTLSVKQAGITVHSEPLEFSKETGSSKMVKFHLPANHVGVQAYHLSVGAIANEKNTINNSKDFAVEVIDEKTKVAIVSDMLHPDLGALKKSIETNEQRECVILKPNAFAARANDFQLVILYQPNQTFLTVLERLKEVSANVFLIAGTKTDWNFLNNQSLGMVHDLTQQTEEFQANLNTGYSNFIIDELDFSSFPPLKGSFGALSLKEPHTVLLYKQIGHVSTQAPLLTTIENEGKRSALLLGENIWRWRAQSYLNESTFHNFDNFIGKLVQYLASKKRKERLVLDYNSFYEGTTNVIVKAQYFNKNYEFDARERLSIFLKDTDNDDTFEYPFILKNKYYEVDLSHLPAANYEFTVKTAASNLSKSGHFRILEYNIEQQFLNANVTKLAQVATDSNGQLYFADNYETLFTDLLENEIYKPVQKSHKATLSLIDWKYLLACIVFCFSAEWFIRKYRGLT